MGCQTPSCKDIVHLTTFILSREKLNFVPCDILRSVSLKIFELL